MIKDGIIAKNLIILRKKKGLTQKELATELNYSDKVISKWERDESLPDILAMETIANYYSIGIDDLLSDLENLDFEDKNLGQTKVLEPQALKAPPKVFEPQTLKGPPKVLYWVWTIGFVGLLISIYYGPVAFVFACIIFLLLNIILGVFLSKFTWQVEYDGHQINIQNLPTKTILKVDGNIVDLDNSIFRFGIKLQGELCGHVVKANVASGFIKMKCSVIIE